MRLKSIFVLLSILLLASELVAQQVVAQNSIFYGTMYRPNGITWMELNSPHFKVVFPEGYEDFAQRTAAILEQELPKTNALTGGKLKRIPVVINTWNDLSNGYVSPFHFRIEVELPPILGKSLNQGNGDWLTYVMAHELVHASHGAVKPSFSLYGLLNLVSPDLYRATNFSAPSGHIEGIAVHHESDSLVSETGRGYYADFVNQFHAVELSDPWTMGQIYFPSNRTQPFNRHYVGGYAFSKWLIDTYGSKIYAKTHDTLIRFPFLGFGFALRVQTGKWPNQLYEDFKKSYNPPSAKRLTGRYLTPDLDGQFERRPQWLNDNEVVFFGRYYDEPSGFFKANISDQNSYKRITETRITEDYRYFLDTKKAEIYWSSALIHPRWDETFVSTLLKATLKNGKRSEVAAPDRVYAPESHSSSSFWTLRRVDDRSELLKVNSDGRILKSYNFEQIDWIAVRQNPEQPDVLAIVAQYFGQQALWILEEDELNRIREIAPDVHFEKHSVFDPEWSPDGTGVLFSSDHSGIRQIYVLKPISKTIAKLTDASFGAMEGQLSPNRDLLAYTQLINNEYRIMIDSLDWGSMVFESLEDWGGNAALKNDYLYTLNSTDGEYPVKKHFSNIGWLKPRYIGPFDGDDGFGFSISSNDLLRRYSYNSDITFFDGEIWHDTEINFKRFYPGLTADIRSFPVQSSVTVRGDPDRDGPLDTQDLGVLDLGIRRQRFDFSVDIPVNLAGNLKQSFLQVEPGIRFDRASFYKTDFDPIVNNVRINDLSADLYTKQAVFVRAALGLGYLQTIRDIVPRSGWLLQTEAVYDYQINNNGALSNLFIQGNALMIGLTRYINLWPKKNQQLQLSLHRYWQQNSLFFDAEAIIHPALESNDLASAFGAIPANILSFRSRWLIPVAFPENGLVTIPTYISSIYLSLNHNTVFNTDNNAQTALHLLGGGLRTQMRFAQISLDIGLGFFWDSNTGGVRSYFGSF